MDLRLELRRKLVHMPVALVLAVLLWNGQILAILAFFLVSLFIVFVYDRHGGFSKLLALVERPGAKYPGFGLVLMLLSATILGFTCARAPATAAMVVLAVGDAAALLVGASVGRISLPWRPEKHLEGRVIGAVLAAILILPLYPFWTGLGVSAVAMLVESFSDNGSPLTDDNLLVPIAAALLFSAA